MKKISFLLTLAWALSLVMSSCQTEESADVNQDRIRADYELFYDKNQNQTTASATFRFGNATGTQLQLTAPAEVKFNNDLLTFNSVLGKYEKTYEGLITSGNFVYSDTQGKKLTNPVPTVKVAEFPTDPAVLTFNKNQNNALAWQGEALGNNENISMLILGTAGLFLQSTPGATTIPVGGSLLQAINPGSYVASMDRATVLPLTQQTSAGGSITSKYRAANKNIQVTD